MGRAEAESSATLGGWRQRWVSSGSGEHAARLTIHVNSRDSHDDDVWNKTNLLNKAHELLILRHNNNADTQTHSWLHFGPKLSPLPWLKQIKKRSLHKVRPTPVGTHA